MYLLKKNESSIGVIPSQLGHTNTTIVHKFKTKNTKIIFCVLWTIPEVCPAWLFQKLLFF